MSSPVQDNSQWLTITEETLLLHDGLMRITDLVELPQNVNNTLENETEIVSFDSRSTKELTDSLTKLCGSNNNAYSQLVEYRLNALKGLWDARFHLGAEEQRERDSASQEETIALLKKHGLWKDPEQASFSTRVSLLLCLPLLQSQSQTDPRLCGITAELLLNCLRDCPPLSLSKEPSDCLNGLETLLASWLRGEVNQELKQKQNTASALIALACARGDLRTFVHTVHLLRQLQQEITELPVADILQALVDVRGGQGQPTSLFGSKHQVCWGYEDVLQNLPTISTSTETDKSQQLDKVEYEMSRSIATNGHFLYLTNSTGMGLFKMGSGLHGTLRGYTYARNPELAQGRVAMLDSLLLHRPSDYDKEENSRLFAQTIDTCSLQPRKTLLLPEGLRQEGGVTTINLCSDGVYFYWMWTPVSLTDKSAKTAAVYLNILSVNLESCEVSSMSQAVCLQKKDDFATRTLSESLLSRLRPYRQVPASAIVTLTAGEASTSSRKDESMTSVAISLKNLMRTPLYCDGGTVVFLTPPVGGSASNSARSLFGGGPAINSLRALASNQCFSVESGQFIQRSDLVDALACALAREANVSSLGLCFDYKNNLIWSVSSDWIDQYCNPGNQALHHIHARLGLPRSPAFTQQTKPKAEPGEKWTTPHIIACLLRHVGSMCLHHINTIEPYTPLLPVTSTLSPSPSLTSCIVPSSPSDEEHLRRLRDILEGVVEEKDLHAIVALLFLLQQMFKMNKMKDSIPVDGKVLSEIRILLWSVLDDLGSESDLGRQSDLDPEKGHKPCEVRETVLHEVCQTINAGLLYFYPDTLQRNALLHRLFTAGADNIGLVKLRYCVLIDLTQQLKLQVLPKQDNPHLRLNAELVHCVLDLAVRESCDLLRKCQCRERCQLEKVTSSVPKASEALCYIMALQSFYLRGLIISNERSSSEDTADYLLNEADRGLWKERLLLLTSDILAAALQVLDVLHEVSSSIVDDTECPDRQYWLHTLERICKGTLLGHCVPLLVTALTHKSLQYLGLAEALMAQVVKLVVSTSQAALLMRHGTSYKPSDDDVSPDCHGFEEAADACSSSLKETVSRAEGFLAGLKVPAPWTSGKVIESVHPVRASYKFKETVQIPGARCLFLRFDPRCSSQYDYDKLILYAGPNTSSHKIAEYGGNTLGYGSRSVLGSGWPKDLVKVEGDCVTFSFEMRSAREHNTPDKAMWGFFVTVRAQESAEEMSHGLPFMADLALALSVMSCSLLRLLYCGPLSSPEEEQCQHLLKSKLLHRCVWQGETFVKVSPQSRDTIRQTAPSATITTPLPRIKLPAEIITKLRDMADKTAPQLRPSLRAVMEPDVLEELVLSAAIKHLSLSETVQHLSSHEEHSSEEYSLLCEVMLDLYHRLYAMIRQLQVLGEMEQRWDAEVEDMRQGSLKSSEAFFIDFHLQENKHRELGILCFLKHVTFDPDDLESAVTSLSECLEVELSQEASDKPSLAVTKTVVEGVVERVNLLLQVTIMPELQASRSLSGSKQQQNIPSMMVRSDTDVLKQAPYMRSMSAPSHSDLIDDSVLDILHLRKKRQAVKKTTSILQNLVEAEEETQEPHVLLLEQLFSFIGSNPEKAVRCESFLSAARMRWRRGHTRQQALVHMKSLLQAASKVGAATHLVSAVTSVLQYGPRAEDLTCGGMTSAVREAFSEAMTSVVSLVSRFPIACCHNMGLLCVIPYTRAEERCLVRSGLVQLLDRLCSLVTYTSPADDSKDKQSAERNVAAMAWAGFQVLSKRCVAWEKEDSVKPGDLEHSGLARQVSSLLTNHLERATDSGTNQAAGNEALQEVLSLLNDLSRSKMGKAILSQPACVSKLLSLLLDKRPSPRLVLITLQLCHVALPLMSSADCQKVKLPSWGQGHIQHILTSSRSDNNTEEKTLQIANLLLAKLGDFLVPAGEETMTSRASCEDSGVLARGGGGSSDKDETEDTSVQDGRLSVFVHKREDQSSHEVIQPLISSTESRPFRLAANMEKVVRMDREITKHGKTEVITEEAYSALRRAAKWAQMGLIVSTGTPVDVHSSNGNGNTSDKKKQAADVICKDKNAELARTDPIRSFISGHVANNMAAKVIALLHSLLTAPETSAAQTWASVVEKVLSHALASLPVLLSSVDDLKDADLEQMMTIAKQANAAMAALGGFEETIKPGCDAQITGEGFRSSAAHIVTVSEQTGVATVQCRSEDGSQQPFSHENIQVPLSRLSTNCKEALPLHQLTMTERIVEAVQSLLLPQASGVSALSHALPVYGTDANSTNNQICRVVAEIRTRACKVLATHLRSVSFAGAFIQHSTAAIDILKSLSKECNTGARLSVEEAQCLKLRMLYRDCAKPPPPPVHMPPRPVKEIKWCPTRVFPPVRYSLFSHTMTGITFLGDPSAGSGLPRGTLVYATQPIPAQAPSFYWEIEMICSFGESPDESGTFISFGFMPAAEKRDGVWTNPVGSCLFHNNGRAVHYNGSSLLQWRSVRLDVNLSIGDTAGIGWERQGDASSVKGLVYFTYNGRRLPATIDDVAGNMWPVVHIQKKNTRIRANFGGAGRKFAYFDGTEHRNAADDFTDATREARDMFRVLPFHQASDPETARPSQSDAAAAGGGETVAGDAAVAMTTPPHPPCRVPSIPKSLREYSSELSVHYKLLPGYEISTHTGPAPGTMSASATEAESDAEDGEEEQATEDHYALLVKAWEQKVFPTIRRRFRNEAERKDGLEQIRGALQLGMTDIARQTVEFLYEENGGLPRELHLPTIDDIKEELAKFTIDRVRKGTTVIIRTSSGGTGSHSVVLPKFAVRGMVRTFGLLGVVLGVDQGNELVQVETYLRTEGVLVRYWYPLDMLERPAQGYRKASLVGDQSLDTSNIFIHRELLQVESSLARMHCRTALLELISQCNSPSMKSMSTPLPVGSNMAASTALLQQLDVENLQLLSNELLIPPQTHGGVEARSLLMSESPSQCLSSLMPVLSRLLYSDSDRMREELRVAITRAANQGEDYLIELTNQLCMCLQTAPEMFPFEEFPVSETKICTDVHFPGAACVVLSCRTDPKAVKKDTSLYKSPWARVYTYRGQRVKKSGQSFKQEVVCFPRDSTSCSNQSSQYAPIIIPANLIHVRVGVSPPPGFIVTIHALPPQFILAIAYIETLVSQKFGFEYLESEESPLWDGVENTVPPRSVSDVIISTTVLLDMTDIISGYLWRTDVPALVKEYVFHLLAQTLRLLKQSQPDVPSVLPILSSKFSPSQGLFVQLKSELIRLYEEETKSWPSMSSGGSSAIGLGACDCGRFSTYFQSLMEVCLAVGEVTCPITPSKQISQKEADLSPLPPLASPTSPVFSANKRKKVKTKGDRAASSHHGGGTPQKSHEIETSSSAHAESGTSSASSSLAPKAEEVLWFERALTMSQVLRYLIDGNYVGEGVTGDAVNDAYQAISQPSAHTRLLVINNIPHDLNLETVKSVIEKTCESAGGLFKGELYLPLLETRELPAESVDTSDQFTGESKSGEKSVSDGDAPTPSTAHSGATKLEGSAVIEVACQAKIESISKALVKTNWLNLDTSQNVMGVTAPEEVITIATVNQNLITSPASANQALEKYLCDKLVSKTGELGPLPFMAFTEIFHSCYVCEQGGISPMGAETGGGWICLDKDQLMLNTRINLMYKFLNGVRGSSKKTLNEQVNTLLRRHGVPKMADKDEPDKKPKMPKKTSKVSPKEKLVQVSSTRSVSRDKKVKSSEKQSKDDPSKSPKAKDSGIREEDFCLTLDGFLSYVHEKIKHDTKNIWRGIFACGYDLHFDKFTCVDLPQALQMSQGWTHEMDTALIKFATMRANKLAVTVSRIHPHEVFFTESSLSRHDFCSLQGAPAESIRLRFSLLQSINNTLETFYLPLLDLRPVLGDPFPKSSASLLSRGRGLIASDTKLVLLNRVVNATALRKPDMAAPEITLDPLRAVGEKRDSHFSFFTSALQQLSSIESSQLCVQLAAGGDPTYAFNVRLVGEEVLGNSGSFRHFLWQAAKELESGIGSVKLFMMSPSSIGQRSRGKFLLRPGPMNYIEEKLLLFLGQLLGITIRADIPFGLDLVSLFWKNLVGYDLDPTYDLQEVDNLTYNYIKKIETVETEAELVELFAEYWPRFVYHSLTGDEVELLPNGAHIAVSLDNRLQYVECIRNLRMSEFLSRERFSVIRAGLSSVIPLHLLSVLLPHEAEKRICGLPHIDLDFLKAHTMYNVGLMETDPHIQFFWTVLEAFSMEELCRFIKFACNQDRIPQTCPCRDGGAETAHVPPYPMKIAPPDGTGNADSRFIRVETCMFMIKLPQYSSLELMRDRLLYAINCREDPLSG